MLATQPGVKTFLNLAVSIFRWWFYHFWQQKSTVTRVSPVLGEAKTHDAKGHSTATIRLISDTSVSSPVPQPRIHLCYCLPASMSHFHLPLEDLLCSSSPARHNLIRNWDQFLLSSTEILPFSPQHSMAYCCLRRVDDWFVMLFYCRYCEKITF